MKAMKTLTAIALFVGLSVPAWSGEFATKDEAIAMVKKAAGYLQKEGAEKAYASFSQKGGEWTDRDLYVVVYSLDGHVLAHGANAKLIGKDMKDATDVDGVYYVKDRIALAAKKVDFWQDYKFVNPVTKKIQPKQMYCHPINDVAVCAGVYAQ